MRYIAAKFPNKQQSEKPYQALQETLRTSKSNASVFRVMLDDIWHIVIMGDHIDTIMQNACDLLLPERQRVTLKEGDRIALENRRNVRTREAKPIAGKPGVRYAETHDPTRVTMDGYPVPLAPGDHSSPAATREKRLVAAKPFTSHIVSSPANSPLTPGSKVKMQVIPFIKGYQDLRRMRETDEVINTIEQTGYLSPTKDKNAMEAIRQVEQVNERVLKAAVKYRFTLSAIAMHQAVFMPGENTWLDPGTHTWIELDQAVNTPHGEEIKAVFVNQAYPKREIDQVIPPHQDQKANTRLHKTFVSHTPYWSLLVITARCETLFDFTYDSLSHRWIFLASHKCPYGECTYPVPANINTGEAGVCLPCAKCKAACVYWSSWLRTALRMINGDYAILPEKPTFLVEPMEYTQEEMVRVGKGKNQRRIKQDVTRHIDYRVVKYEVSIARAASPEKEEAKGDHKPNWLTLHGKEDRIYEKRQIPARARQYTATHHNHLVQAVQAGLTASPTNGEEYILTSRAGEVIVIGKIKAHEKYIPLLKPETRKADTIRKVTASRYESEAK